MIERMGQLVVLTLVYCSAYASLLGGLPLMVQLVRSNTDSTGSETKFAAAVLSAVVVLGTIVAFWKTSQAKSDRSSVYGLQHGRLHIDAHVPMWMNMGYWKHSDTKNEQSPSMARACRDLLRLVLSEARFSQETAMDRSRCLIDVGFGCGDQTIHLMSDQPVRRCDELWWDTEACQMQFDQYIGITQDTDQYRYARARVDEIKHSIRPVNPGDVSLFCANAARPELWSDKLLGTIDKATSKSQENWLLALDTAYHFSPSRWGLIEYACQDLNASFMAFDLCLSPNATLLQKLVLRTLTALMSAPWTNFVTPDVYRQKLVDAGYQEKSIKVLDISEHVFAPLASYMEEQDIRLKRFGLGLGSFQAAKRLFRWWGATGVMRGVVVVAIRSQEDK